MKYRKLRIAWSVGCGILCVLLIVLWVRSYWLRDVVYGWLPFPLYLQLDSVCGDLKLIANAESQPAQLRFNTHPPEPSEDHWRFSVVSHSQYRWWLDLKVPHWFVLFFLASFAFAPWLRWSTRFGLRTLLIATTLVAVVLGLVIWSRGS